MIISSENLHPQQIIEDFLNRRIISLSSESEQNLKKTRSYLDSKINSHNELIYGINTGFGSLCNVEISTDQIEELQEKLVMSHACGSGPTIARDISKLILLLKILSLSKSNSGVRPELVKLLIELYNKDIIPVIYEQGSLGASGDLAPLAHLALTVMGMGKVWTKDGQISDTDNSLRQYGVLPLKLKAKEGLALLNGTQFSTAHLLWCTTIGMRLFDLSNKIASLSADAFLCDYSPFDSLIHQIRPHKGQILVASAMRDYLSGSDIKQGGVSVQDPYSFRCIPQVHGAVFQILEHVMSVVEIESNSVTDNPNIFADDDKVLSGGNFHAQPIAFALDYLALGLSELASISERRIYQLINGDRGLPPFLVSNPGLNSGFMIIQYTAASIVSQNKQLCTPASIDSIVSSKGQEDHVSMAANAGTKCLKILENLMTVLALEMMVASQALDFRRPQKTSDLLEDFHADFRTYVNRLDDDREMRKDIELSLKFLKKAIGVE